MDLKIEIDGKIMEAAIKVVDDTMVVSPKIEKYEPKDGEIVTVTTKTGMSYTCFFNRYVNGCIYSYGGLNHLLNKFFDGDLVCCRSQLETIYPAAEGEKMKLFDKLKEEGYEWKPATKELVKLKWKPKEGELYWTPLFDVNELFDSFDLTWREEREGLAILKRGWVFRTEEECQEFCNRLNDSINSVKP